MCMHVCKCVQMTAGDSGVTYGQCHQIIRCVTDLVDNMSLLVQAIGAVVRGLTPHYTYTVALTLMFMIAEL